MERDLGERRQSGDGPRDRDRRRRSLTGRSCGWRGRQGKEHQESCIGLVPAGAGLGFSVALPACRHSESAWFMAQFQTPGGVEVSAIQTTGESNAREPSPRFSDATARNSSASVPPSSL